MGPPEIEPNEDRETESCVSVIAQTILILICYFGIVLFGGWIAHICFR